MQTIVFAARKGGCSKTTLTAHLAVAASGAYSVTLIDADPQHSLSDWWNDRKADFPALMEVSVQNLARELKKAEHQDGLVMVDTPPLDSKTISAVIAVADLVVIPVKPSPHDLRGVSVTVDMVKAAGKPFIFVVTQAVARAALTAQAALVLSQFGPVATTVMNYRVDYAGAMTDGRTVQELDPKSKATQEIVALWAYLNAHLSKPAREQRSNTAFQQISA
jgi:chromosome partitioning protein